MVLLLVVVLVFGYAIAASRAARHGLGRLWFTASVALALVIAGSVALGRYHAVPSLSRLLMYVGALTAPVVVVPTALLSLLRPPVPPSRRASGSALATAFAGACLGLVFGFVITVFGLRVW